MAEVVQAKCPGCNKVLRIPAEWANKPIKCKHCGKILNAREKLAPAPAPAAAAPSAPAKKVKQPLTETIPQPAGSASPPNKPSSKHASTVDWPADPYQRTFAPRSQLIPRIIKGLGLLVAIGALLGGGAFLVRQLKDKGYVEEKQVSAGAEGGVPAAGEAGKATARPANLPWPRRVLAVGIHNYLYANPLGPGDGDRNFHNIVARLGTRLRIPAEQLTVLSDVAPEPPSDGSVPKSRRGKAEAKPKAAGEFALRPPLKPVLEKAIDDFTESSRAQDRILLLFAGHAVDIEDEAYLVPLEGDPTAKDTLLPLKWLYEKLAKCKARQKVLILDVCRYDPGRGKERPGSEPMSAKLEAAIAKVPEGVQVWTSCMAEQNSYEFGGRSVFLGKLYEALDTKKKAEGFAEPEDPLPIDNLVRQVNKPTEDEVRDDQRAKQTPHVHGKEAAGGAPFDPQEAPAARVNVTMPVPAGGSAKPEDIQAILAEVAVPPIRLGNPSTASLHLETLVPFPAKVLEAYRADYNSEEQLKAEVKGKPGEPSAYPLRAAVMEATSLLRDSVTKVRFHETLTGGVNEKNKLDFANDQRGPAALLRELEEAKAKLEKVGETRDQEKSKRWQAHYDYILAQTLARMAYVHEYNLMLGKIRKDELPTLEKVHTGYRLASRDKVQSGKEVRDLVAQSKKILTQLAKENPNTPWEVLAKRDKLTALGLEWQPTR